MLEVIELNKYYHSKKVLNNISFSVEAGESLAVVGSVGAGKSTLFSLIAGLYPVSLRAWFCYLLE